MSPPSKQNAKAPKTGKAFRRIRAAIVGEFYQGNLVSQWMRRNGGEFHDKVSDKITHLIASEEAYEQNVEEVQTAKALGKIKIVSRDWLTASLHANPIRPVPERPFLLENLIKPKKTTENKNRVVDSGSKSRIRYSDPFVQKKSPKGSKNIASRMTFIHTLAFEDTAKKAVLRDSQTGSAWDAVLLREGKTSRLRDKYRLAIFETSSQPPTYSTWAKYSRVGTSRVEELTPPKSDAATAVRAFKQFFKAETGKDWENREDDKLPAPKTDGQGNVLPHHEGWYSYESHDNVFTSYLMQAGPSGGSTDSTMSADPRDAPGEPETVIAQPETAVPEVAAQPKEDSGNNADVDSDSTVADACQPAKSEPAVDTDTKTESEFQ
ncbi:uncharacterized protein N7496_012018 [Penicillium cataractarum]|uniref:BRCT domain-containing protein n=1 Tax=Penicillium cataractarum TaxID=2100454 RepID=A0A9W9UY91_9EURO|nr:uncharacterized protein N7496_012018 [Penicillium cataractarum]KAJ5359605.1 hypothetical protein N7496_012018 [Penicillium cataractarum]